MDSLGQGSAKFFYKRPELVIVLWVCKRISLSLGNILGIKGFRLMSKSSVMCSCTIFIFTVFVRLTWFETSEKKWNSPWKTFCEHKGKGIKNIENRPMSLTGFSVASHCHDPWQVRDLHSLQSETHPSSQNNCLENLPRGLHSWKRASDRPDRDLGQGPHILKQVSPQQQSF